VRIATKFGYKLEGGRPANLPWSWRGHLALTAELIISFAARELCPRVGALSTGSSSTAASDRRSDCCAVTV
jgi:hypothetical protein